MSDECRQEFRSKRGAQSIESKVDFSLSLSLLFHSFSLKLWKIVLVKSLEKRLCGSSKRRKT